MYEKWVHCSLKEAFFSSLRKPISGLKKTLSRLKENGVRRGAHSKKIHVKLGGGLREKIICTVLLRVVNPGRVQGDFRITFPRSGFRDI